MEIHITINGRTIILTPGDVLDLGEFGIVKWFGPEEAEGVRIIDQVRRAEVHKALGHAPRYNRYKKPLDLA